MSNSPRSRWSRRCQKADSRPNYNQVIYDTFRDMFNKLYDALDDNVAELASLVGSTFDGNLFIPLPSGLSIHLATWDTDHWDLIDFRLPERVAVDCVLLFSIGLATAAFIFESVFDLLDIDISFLWNWLFDIDINLSNPTINNSAAIWWKTGNTYTQNTSQDKPYALSHMLTDGLMVVAFTLIVAALLHYGMKDSAHTFLNAMHGTTNLVTSLNSAKTANNAKTTRELLETFWSTYGDDVTNMASAVSTVTTKIDDIVETLDSMKDAEIINLLKSIKSQIGLRLSFK